MKEKEGNIKLNSVSKTVLFSEYVLVVDFSVPVKYLIVKEEERALINSRLKLPSEGKNTGKLHRGCVGAPR